MRVLKALKDEQGSAADVPSGAGEGTEKQRGFRYKAENVVLFKRGGGGTSAFQQFLGAWCTNLL